MISTCDIAFIGSFTYEKHLSTLYCWFDRRTIAIFDSNMDVVSISRAKVRSNTANSTASIRGCDVRLHMHTTLCSFKQYDRDINGLRRIMAEKDKDVELNK